MWLYFCYSLVFAHVLGINLAKLDKKNDNEPAKDPEIIFAGVIKNISRVNNVLQELISNYEQLQKIYKSQENLDSGTTDYEMDEVFKSKKKRDRAESKTIQPAGYHPATEMTWSGYDKQSEEYDVSSSDGHGVEKDNKASDEQDEKRSSDEIQTIIKSNDHKNSMSVKIPRHKSKPKEPAILSQEVAKQKQAEIIFVDTHQKSSSEEQKKGNHVSQKTTDQASKISKTRYSKVSRTHPESNSKHKNKKKTKEKIGLRILTADEVSESELTNNKPINNETSDGEPNKNASKNSEAGINEPKIKPLYNVDNKRKVEKKLHSESFSSKDIWDDIINNKPIQLEDHTETVAKKDDMNSVVSIRAFVSSVLSKHKPALANITNKNQISHINNNSADNSDSAEEARNDKFQANVLRKAYGDACLKLVIRKCYKACKAATKLVCSDHKCKSSFKSKFKEYSKTGCIKEFDGKNIDENYDENKETGKINSTNNHDSTKRGNAGSDNSGDIVDLPSLRTLDTKPGSEKKHVGKANKENAPAVFKEGYLQTCLPHMQEKMKGDVLQPLNFRNETTRFSITPIRRSFNILRDKYERECKKISYNKCRSACSFAYKESCEVYPCTKDKTRAYKKACTTECKAAYQLERDSSRDSTSSDSDSDSDSESESDSDSDSISISSSISSD